jgi:DNA-binding NarL/FixJ family response regulator
MAVRLLILVQERIFADALSTRLEAEPDLEIVAALHAKAPSPHLLTASRADVILIDGDLPEQAALRLCEKLTSRPGAPRVIMLSRSSDPRAIVRAVEVGVAGWVRTDESLARLMFVVRGVARGETWLPAGDTGDVLRLLLRGPGREPAEPQPLGALTARERQVLACLADGAGRREVARRLHMSPNTVRTHVQNLMSKLGVHSTLEAVALTRPHLAPRPALTVLRQEAR